MPLPYLPVSFLLIPAERSSDFPLEQWTLLTATSNVFERASRRAAVCGNVLWSGSENSTDGRLRGNSLRNVSLTQRYEGRPLVRRSQDRLRRPQDISVESRREVANAATLPTKTIPPPLTLHPSSLALFSPFLPALPLTGVSFEPEPACTQLSSFKLNRNGMTDVRI